MSDPLAGVGPPRLQEPGPLTRRPFAFPGGVFGERGLFFGQKLLQNLAFMLVDFGREQTTEELDVETRHGPVHGARSSRTNSIFGILDEFSALANYGGGSRRGFDSSAGP